MVQSPQADKESWKTKLEDKTCRGLTPDHCLIDEVLGQFRLVVPNRPLQVVFAPPLLLKVPGPTLLQHFSGRLGLGQRDRIVPGEHGQE